MQRHSIEYIKQKALENNWECLFEEYKNNKQKLKFKCSRGHEFETTGVLLLRGCECKKCTIEDQRKFKINEGFFEEETEEVFYIAGFLAADGWVYANNGYSVGLELGIKDLAHLEKINKILESSYPINIMSRNNAHLNKYGKVKKKVSELCSLRIYSKKIYEDLGKFGIVENKTEKLVIPEWVIEHKNLNHYLRGYLDGDGCYYKSGNKTQISISSEKKVLEQIDNIFIKLGLTKKSKKVYLHHIGYGAAKEVEGIINYLYNGAGIYLDRKFPI